jgi:hypothetical protein
MRFFITAEHLNLHFLETVLPESGVGGDTVITEVNQDVPSNELVKNCLFSHRGHNIHSVTVHGMAHKDIVVVIVAKDLLDRGGGTLLESIDLLLGSTLLLKLGENLLHVG